jgi:hypothetical protein
MIQNWSLGKAYGHKAEKLLSKVESGVFNMNNVVVSDRQLSFSVK